MSPQRVNQPRRHRDTEILRVFVSLWLTLSVLSASSVSITRTKSSTRATVLDETALEMSWLLHDGTAVELTAICVHSDISLSNYLLVPPADLKNFRELFPVVTQAAAE